MAAVVTLSSDQREGRLAVPERRGDRLLIEVRPVPSATPQGATISIFAPGQDAPLGRLALYPFDRPARFAVVVPADVTQVRVRVDPAEVRPLGAVEVRFVTGPDQ